MLKPEVDGNLLSNATGWLMLNVKGNTDNNSQKGSHRVITSEALFAGSRELVIKHAGDEYRLRLTSQGKLILTK